MYPYLSIIATTRNDNHGGDLLDRTIAFVNGIYYQAKKFNVQIELILIEWNPPSDRQSLRELIPFPDKEIPVTLRIIQVPHSIHQKYKTHQLIPLYQMTAKNVGIRRAKGEFILCTNVDLLFSDQLFLFLSSKKLEKGKFYRANRCDVPKDILRINGFENRLKFAKKNILRRLGKRKGLEGASFPDFLSYSTILARIYYYPLIWLWKLLHPRKFPYFKIDFMACGDFTLMSKQDWMDIEGYVELDMYSIHIDSMALWAASALQKKQILLPPDECSYHIDHENGWESKDVHKTIKFLESKPCLDYSIVERGGMELIYKKEHWKLNNSNWGFVNEPLKEYIFEPGNKMIELN